MRKIKTRGHTVEIPETIEELTPRQYEEYCRVSRALLAGIIDLDFWRVRWMSYLIGMGSANFTMLKKPHREELYRQLDALEGFLVKNADGTPEPDFGTPRNLLPEFRTHKGPGDWLNGMTYGDFTECLNLFSAANADEEHAGECLERVTRIMYHIEETSLIPDLLTFHAVRFFLAVWHEIQSGPVEYNGRDIDFRIIFRGKSTRPDDGTGWAGVTLEVAQSGVFGPVRDVMNADLWEVLLYLYKCKFEHDNENKS